MNFILVSVIINTKIVEILTFRSMDLWVNPVLN